jgi:hypothetical protein
MVPSGAATHDGRVPRLLVLWCRPSHLTTEETERWVRTEVRGLRAGQAIRSLQLTRLESASPRHGRDYHWLLELDVSGPVRECVEHGPCAEWLGDLRLLGMRPAVVVAADAIVLEGDDG